jgi:UDP-N-acetylglucosamine:LPS N-acetylglucosamine transferase
MKFRRKASPPSRMLQKKHFLILISDSGFGHRSAANSIAAALALKFPDQVQTSIINPIFEHPTSILLHQAEKHYDRAVSQYPKWWRFAYDITNTKSTSFLLENTLTLALFRNIHHLIKELLPDVIISTNLMFGAPTGLVLSALKMSIPFYMVVTDFADVHSMWFNANPDRFYVASDLVRSRAVSCGIDPQKIIISGIPVNPVFSFHHPQKSELKKSLGLDPNLTTFLIVGSRRVSGIPEFIRSLELLTQPFQVVVIAGGDNALYEQCSSQAWSFPIHFKNFVTDMPEWMLASDLLITKAGGLIISEGLAAGLPIMMIDYLPGQEERNAKYVLEHRAGEIVTHPDDFSRLIASWLKNDQAILKEMAKNSRRLGHPDASYTIADDLWQVAHQDIRQAPSTTNLLALN